MVIKPIAIAGPKSEIKFRMPLEAIWCAREIFQRSRDDIGSKTQQQSKKSNIRNDLWPSAGKPRDIVLNASTMKNHRNQGRKDLISEACEEAITALVLKIAHRIMNNEDQIPTQAYTGRNGSP